MALGLSRSTARYRARPDRDEKVIALCVELAERFPEQGFNKLFQLIRWRCLVWNHKGCGVIAIDAERSEYQM